MNKLPSEIKLGALTTINSASGRTAKDDDGNTIGILTLETAVGSIELTLASFDAIYKGFVNCWPAVTPLKQKVILAQREEVKAQKQKEREEAANKKKAERDEAKKKREKEIADRKAEKEAEKKAAQEKRDADRKAAEEAKRKADMEAAKKAAEKKDKEDKEKKKQPAKK